MQNNQSAQALGHGSIGRYSSNQRFKPNSTRKNLIPDDDKESHVEAEDKEIYSWAHRVKPEKDLAE